ncbi:hypothetical protein D9619_007803 [Psilocybe cf. subviscida]|uniref:Uncharacterized protein n=1 Tax=Psilocybe cf. subviscida TaxID=2480587 RepID=A0A8H5AUR9_9AGAR|nr:hypothetical protein D9619_007803 [Psilocybe cf. subviscida]
MLELSSGINVVQARAEKRPLLVTLNRHNIPTAGQELLDISEESEPVLYCKGRRDQEEIPVRLQYIHDSDEKFPPNTSGFLYHMIQDENMASVEEINNQLSAQRVVATLSPQYLSSKGQSVMDISGIRCALPNFNGCNQQLYYSFNHRDQIRYPADTKGVYYYRQSRTAPTTLGELRFRLCFSVQSFEEGSDLCVPSGLSWAISSYRILSTPGFSAIREQLIKEGLIKGPPPLFVQDCTVPIQVTLHQPFIIDLSGFRFNVPFQIGTEVKSFWIQNLFTVRGRPSAYRGRAVVQFERYPTQGYPQRTTKLQSKVLAMRFLEFLTPIEMTGDGDPSALQYPEVGQLLFRRDKRRKYSPRGYSPQNQDMQDSLLRLWMSMLIGISTPNGKTHNPHPDICKQKEIQLFTRISEHWVLLR